MKSKRRIFALIAIFLIGATVAGGATFFIGNDDGSITNGAQPHDIAKRAADNLAAGRYQAVVDRLTPAAQLSLSVEVLRGGWAQLVDEVGPHRSNGDPVTRGEGIISVPLKFTKGVVDLEVGIEPRGGIKSLFLRDRFAAGTGREPSADDPKVVEATAIASALAEADWDRARQNFSAELQKAIDIPKLETVWREALAAGGPFERQIPGEVFDRGPSTVVVVPLQFSSAIFELRVTFDKAGVPVGLFLQPSERRPPN